MVHGWGGAGWDVDRVINLVWRLDTLADVSNLMKSHG